MILLSLFNIFSLVVRMKLTRDLRLEAKREIIDFQFPSTEKLCGRMFLRQLLKLLLNNFDSASDKDMVVSIVLASCHSTEGESVLQDETKQWY